MRTICKWTTPIQRLISTKLFVPPRLLKRGATHLCRCPTWPNCWRKRCRCCCFRSTLSRSYVRALYEHADLCDGRNGVGHALGTAEHAFGDARLDGLLARQLSEPLLAAARALPAWVRDVAVAPARLVSLDTRRLYFRTTGVFLQRVSATFLTSSAALGTGRALEAALAGSNDDEASSTLGSANRPQVRLARLERTKIRVRREAALACGMRALGACRLLASRVRSPCVCVQRCAATPSVCWSASFWTRWAPVWARRASFSAPCRST